MSCFSSRETRYCVDVKEGGAPFAVEVFAYSGNIRKSSSHDDKSRTMDVDRVTKTVLEAYSNLFLVYICVKYNNKVVLYITSHILFCKRYDKKRTILSFSALNVDFFF